MALGFEGMTVKTEKPVEPAAPATPAAQGPKLENK